MHAAASALLAMRCVLTDCVKSVGAEQSCVCQEYTYVMQLLC